MSDYWVGALSGAPMGAAGAALLGLLVRGRFGRRVVPPSTVVGTMTHPSESTSSATAYAMRRRAELVKHADSLAGDNDELRQMLHRLVAMRGVL